MKSLRSPGLCSTTTCSASTRPCCCSLPASLRSRKHPKQNFQSANIAWRLFTTFLRSYFGFLSNETVPTAPAESPAAYTSRGFLDRERLAYGEAWSEIIVLQHS